MKSSFQMLLATVWVNANINFFRFISITAGTLVRKKQLVAYWKAHRKLFSQFRTENHKMSRRSSIQTCCILEHLFSFSSRSHKFWFRFLINQKKSFKCILGKAANVEIKLLTLSMRYGESISRQTSALFSDRMACNSVFDFMLPLSADWIKLLRPNRENIQHCVRR